MENKTVVGWDASAQAEAALRWAVAREAARKGTVALVFVVEDRNDSLGEDEAERQLTEARAALRDAAQRVRGMAPQCEVTTVAVRGSVADTLLDYVYDEWVLAVGAVDRVSDRPRSSRSVGVRLAAAALGPVAVVPDRGDERGTGIVVGIDGSPAGDTAAAFAAEEAVRLGEQLTVVHAWAEPVMMEGQPILDPQFVAALSGESAQILDAAKALAVRAAPGVSLATRSTHGQPVHALLRASEGARALVLGSRGLRGIRRVLLGSVSRDLVMRSDCPTIVVGRAPEPFAIPDPADAARAFAR